MVYDITSRDTFQSVASWLRELGENVERREDLCLTLIGNKCDLRHLRAISRDEALQLAEANGMNFVETSALDCINIEATFKDMVAGIYKRIEVEIEAACDAKYSARTVSVSLDEREGMEQKCCS